MFPFPQRQQTYDQHAQETNYYPSENDAGGITRNYGGERSACGEDKARRQGVCEESARSDH